MYNVAIIDSEPTVLTLLNNLIKKYSLLSGVEFEITKYTSGISYLKSKNDNSNNNDNIVFLGIDLPNAGGLKLAHKILDKDSKTIIIIIANSAQYAINGYDVNALGYIVKPVRKRSIDLILDKACGLLKNQQLQRVSVKTVHGQVLLSLSEIAYIEIQKHNLFIYTCKDGKYNVVRTRGSMQEMYAKLKNTDFVRCSTSYLVNMNYILSVLKSIVYLPGVKILISRTYKQEFTKRFAKFLIDRGIENIGSSGR